MYICAGDYCTLSEAGLTTYQLVRWISSVSRETNRTYITADGGKTIFTAKSLNQAEDAFLSEIHGKVNEIWMNNSPYPGICVQKLIQKYQKKPPKIHISHLYSPGDLGELEAKRCLAKLVKLKFKIDMIDWMALSKMFTNVQCRNQVKNATGSPKFLDALDKLSQQLKDIQQLSKDPNIMKYCNTRTLI